MNRPILLLLFAVLIPVVGGAEIKGQVMIDSYHNIRNENFNDKVQILNALLQSGGFGKATRYEPLSYPLLKNYDILVLLAPTSSLSSGEISEVLRFVQEGGGVLLIGESKDYIIERVGNTTWYFNAEYLNALSRRFGITFNRDTLSESREGRIAHDIVISNFEKHALTEGVTYLNLVVAATLNISGKAVKVASGSENTYSQVYEIVSYPPVGAASRYGYGRIVAVSDTEGYLQQDNKFLLNAFNWLNVKPKLIEANAYSGNATQLLLLNDYNGAKEKFERALNTYASLEISEKVNETKVLIATCDKGISANSLMNAAYSNYNSKKYAEAKAGFEEANKLYAELNYTAKIVESQVMIDKSTQFTIAFSQFSEGTKYFNSGEYSKAKEAFEDAKKKFASSGDAEMIKKSEEMASKSSKGIEALSLFSLGETQFKNKDFTNARSSIFQAKEIFADLGNAQKVQEAQAAIEKANKYLAAYSRYNEAQVAFSKGEYEKARDTFSEARELFTELGDQEMSGKSSEMVESSVTKIRERTTFRAAVVAGVSVLLACGAIFMWWKSRQTKLEKAPKVKISRKTAKIKDIEEEIKKLELRYAQGGLSKIEYISMRRNLEEKIEAEERRGKKLLFP